jgi:hypothetical protein
LLREALCWDHQPWIWHARRKKHDFKFGDMFIFCGDALPFFWSTWFLLSTYWLYWFYVSAVVIWAFQLLILLPLLLSRVWSVIMDC